MKLARLERKIANRRENWNNFISMDIVRTASVIGIETLSIRNMFRNRHLADALSDASMSTLLGMIQYKSAWYGTECRQIGRWMPSSKTCSVCGYVKKDMTLKDREWKCPECGTMHDRDINAAMNILKYATC
jgi:putative transposase